MEGEHSVHHMLPKSREKEGYNVHHPGNLIKLKNKLHQDLHRLFGNMTPDEQIRFILDLNKKIIDDNSYNRIHKTVSSMRFYKDHLYK